MPLSNMKGLPYFKKPEDQIEVEKKEQSSSNNSHNTNNDSNHSVWDIKLR